MQRARTTGREWEAAPSRLASDAGETDVLVRDRVDRPERVFAAVMSTDVARPTRQLPTIERSWPELLREYARIVHRQVVRYNGGTWQFRDGASVRFSSAYSAVRCALAIREDLRDVGLDLRAGLHAGTVDALDEDMTEDLVRVASRICCVAEPGCVLASRFFGESVEGPGLAFEEVPGCHLDDVLGEGNLVSVHRSA